MDTLHKDPHTFLHVPQAQLTKYLLLPKMFWTNITQKDKHTIYSEWIASRTYQFLSYLNKK
jgi:hypothetical protein